MNEIFANHQLYWFCFVLSLLISLALTPLFRYFAIKSGKLDKPTEIKTHKNPVPMFGGAAVFSAVCLSLLAVRYYTSFPTGTLHDLRVILSCGAIMFLLGLIDDIKKPKGLSVKFRFFIQFAVAAITVYYGFGIKFLHPEYLAVLLSVIWIVGVSNAVNLIDIMDGLSSSQVAIAAFGFLFISFPSESIYVNFASAALAGGVIGFIPFNISKKLKIFMGDSGSLFCGYFLSVIALGASYSNVNPLGVYAPILVLFVPIFDTFFVSLLRISRGCSPFKGSKDHFALRLEKMGLSRTRVVEVTACFSVCLGFFAWLLTNVTLPWGMLIILVTALVISLIAGKISKIEMC